MCIFCKLQKDNQNIIFETKHFYSIYDQYPVSKGHTLIISKRHVESFFNLTKEEIIDGFELLIKLKNEVDTLFKPDGFNLGVNDGKYAGQTIMHCHIHLIPRYQHDVEDPEGGVRGVIPSKQKYKR
jgi:diadenosine tetraphosphate (Ap4A) HIT family hydrolase